MINACFDVALSDSEVLYNSYTAMSVRYLRTVPLSELVESKDRSDCAGACANDHLGLLNHSL